MDEKWKREIETIWINHIRRYSPDIFIVYSPIDPGRKDNFIEAIRSPLQPILIEDNITLFLMRENDCNGLLNAN